MLNSPVPEFNSGLGFCYFPDDAHYRTADTQAWLPELKALGASWLTVLGSPVRAIPETFIRELVEAAIEPVIHIPVPVNQPIDPAILETICTSYARWGVHYVVLYDKPNVKGNWNLEDWAQPDLVSRFVDLLLPALQIIDRAGLTPVFPPLQQGGDYWDTSFLDVALGHLKARGQVELLKRLVFAHYAFAFNRPADWGAGGQARWSQTQPYNAPPNSQDQRGFRAFEWYAEVIRSRLGEYRPLLMLAGGSRMGDAADPAFPAVDEIGHATCNVDIMQAMTNRQLPAYLLNVNFYLLSAPPDTPPAQYAWYQSDGTTLPAVGAFKQQIAEAIQAVADFEKQVPRGAAADSAGRKSVLPEGRNGQSEPGSHTVRSGDRPLYHYLLLPTFEWGISNWHWAAVLAYVNRFKPACGFSAAEALAADYVTIVGSEQGIPAEVEQRLRDGGCQVERVSGRDGAETQLRLDALAESGRRFSFAE